MNKGVTLSLQSLDEEVLKATKRSNIKLLLLADVVLG
jgi:hypothetical protein